MKLATVAIISVLFGSMTLPMPVSAATAKLLTYKMVSRAQSSKDADYKWQFPIFRGQPAPVVAALNRIVSAEVKAAGVAPKEERGDIQRKNQHTLTYKVRQFDDFVLIDTTNYDYIGGIHGNAGLGTTIYKMHPFRKVTLPDLFGQKVDYKLISDLCQLKLYQSLQAGDTKFVNGGTEAAEDSFACYSIGPDGITFTFQQYQVAPYSEGMPSVTLTWGELNPLIKPSSPVYAIAQKAKPSTIAVDAKLRKKEKAVALSSFLKRTAQ